MPLEVIGAGFGRTGTSSLKQALETLGFDRCYHMFEVGNNKAAPQYWLDADAGREVDWEQLFSGYRAAVDWPACHFYRELHEMYPDAKVVLTVRDAAKWYRSAKETIYPMSHSFPRWSLFINQGLRVFHQMIEEIVWQGTFEGKFLSDPEGSQAIFNRHIEEVKQAIPAEQLLVFESTQGWEPLCEFLGVEVPSEPYPRANDAEEMKAQIAKIKWVFRGIHILGAIGIVALAGFLLS